MYFYEIKPINTLTLPNNTYTKLLNYCKLKIISTFKSKLTSYGKLCFQTRNFSYSKPLGVI